MSIERKGKEVLADIVMNDYQVRCQQEWLSRIRSKLPFGERENELEKILRSTPKKEGLEVDDIYLFLLHPDVYGAELKSFLFGLENFLTHALGILTTKELKDKITKAFELPSSASREIFLRTAEEILSAKEKKALEILEIPNTCAGREETFVFAQNPIDFIIAIYCWKENGQSFDEEQAKQAQEVLFSNE